MNFANKAVAIACAVSIAIQTWGDQPMTAAQDKAPKTPSAIIAHHDSIQVGNRRINATPARNFKFPTVGTPIPRTKLKVGDKLPPITGKTLAGEEFTLTYDAKSKATLVVFWSATCAPCLQEFPYEQALYDTYKDQGFRIVSVNTDRKQRLAIQTVKKHGIGWPTVADGANGPIVQSCGVTSNPILLLVDARGTILMATPELRNQRISAPDPDNIVVYPHGLTTALAKLFSKSAK